MKITLLCIGSLKTSWAKIACEDYYVRILGGYDLIIIELPASKSKDTVKQSREESDRIEKALEKRSGIVWVLDERGKTNTSKDFSIALQEMQDLGEELIIVLGGAYGLSQEIRNKADVLVSFGAMTLPHELARVVLFEQLYRSVQIQRGTGYHH